VRVLRDDPRTVGPLGGQQVVEDISSEPATVGRGHVEHPVRTRSRERVRVDLPVRMRLRDADLRSPVLEAEHLLDSRVRGQVPGPIDPYVEHQTRLVVGQVGE
jgi:hypothetical protein